MIWLTWKLITLPFRLVFGTLGITYKTVRIVGVSRILAFGAGVAAGLALAPEKGTEFRARVMTGAKSVASPPDLAAAVRHELAHSPRTWHLPQPTVTVEGSRVTLTGEAPHETARADLGRTAGSVIGVSAIDNQIVITSTGTSGDVASR